MFKTREAGTAASVPPAASHKGKAAGMFSVLGPDVVVSGNIAAGADLHIDGRVEGDVACATLTTGVDSMIQGSVTAEAARLSGTIEGSVRVRQLVVERGARIAGDIEYEGIAIENGAQVEGSLRRVTAATPVAATPLKAVSTGDDAGAERLFA